MLYIFYHTKNLDDWDVLGGANYKGQIILKLFTEAFKVRMIADIHRSRLGG